MELRGAKEQIIRDSRAIETGHSRTVVTGAVFAVLFLVLAGRVIDLSLFQGNQEPQLLRAESHDAIETTRANIMDRNGVLLATSLPTDSLFVDSKALLESGEDPVNAARDLTRALPGLSYSKALEKLSSGNRFEYLVRNLTPNNKHQVNQLGIPGLQFQREERRTYPQGPLLSHILGYTDVDGRGISGVEKSFDSQLLGSGGTLQLSIDVRIQSIVRRALMEGIDKFKAIGGAGIVMDIHTGELISIVSLPDFDPNDPNSIQGDAGFNRATKGVYEMGSIFKLFNTAMALDSGVVSITDKFDASDPIKAGRFKITDYHGKHRPLSVPEILVFSSNIGSAKMALEAGTPLQRDYMTRFGLLNTAALEIPEVGAPLFPDHWGKVSTMTIAYGHGIAISPLQLSSAISAVTNGGLLLPATLLKIHGDEKVPAQRIISAETSEQMLKLMRLVVLQGSGKNANSQYYHVGGKTGTADKPEGGRYNRNARISSFAGVFPIEDPKYAILVMVDEPVGIKESYGFATAGWVAAPIVKKIVDSIGPMLGMQPARTKDVNYMPGTPLFINVKE
jgi:cell division protein FtsI (penicillin-binding protein 3)